MNLSKTKAGLPNKIWEAEPRNHLGRDATSIRAAEKAQPAPAGELASLRPTINDQLAAPVGLANPKDRISVAALRPLSQAP
jgi:hypothetical protein